MPTVINSTQLVIEDQQAIDIDMAEALLAHELHKRTEAAKTNQENYASAIRVTVYQATMNAITNSDHWDTPDTHYRSGRPQGLENHGQTSHGGAYADAEKMVSMGYAIGAF